MKPSLLKIKNIPQFALYLGLFLSVFAFQTSAVVIHATKHSAHATFAATGQSISVEAKSSAEGPCGICCIFQKNKSASVKEIHVLHADVSSSTVVSYYSKRLVSLSDALYSARAPPAHS